MSKDFRAKQVRTNKIIGRSDAAVAGGGTKIQLALMKSGSANFAGGITSAGAGGGADVGRLGRDIGNIGSDVWMVVDGGQTNRALRSDGETVLFLGDIVVSGTVYAERQRINITTTTLSANTDNSLILSGSTFITQDQGLTVGKKVDGDTDPFGSDPFKDPRSGLVPSAGGTHNLGPQDSVFFDGQAAPQGLLVIRPNDDSNKGRVGVGVSDPNAKLEVFGTDTHVRLSYDQLNYSTLGVGANGDLTITTVDDGGGTAGNAVFNIDGAVDINATTAVTIDSSTSTISIGADNVNQNINIGTDGQREITIGDASAANSAGLTLRANTGGIDIDCQQATGDLQLDTAGGAIHIGHNAAAGNISIGTNATARTITMGNVTGATGLVLNAGTNGVAINSTGNGDIVINSDDVMTLDSDGVLEINSSAGAISIGNDDVAQAINVGTGAAARTITIGNATGATEIDVNTGTGGFKVDTQSGGGISLDAVAAASNLTVSTGGADEKDLTLSVAGGGNSSLFITSTGTGADSLEIDTTAGSMTIAKSLADGQTLKVGKNGAVEMIFSPHGTAANEKWSLINTSGDAADALKLQAVAGGLDIDAGTSVLINAAAASSFITSAGDITVDATTSSLNLLGGEADAAAVKIHADHTNGGIDIDAGTAGIDIATTGAFSIDGAAPSNITVDSGATDENLTIAVTGATASSLILSSAGTGLDAIDIDATAGGIDIDATGQINIDAGGQLFLEGTGDSRLRTNSSGNLNVESAAILSHTGATGVNITATNNSVAITGNTEVDLTAAFVDINAGVNGLDVDAGAGGIELDTTGALSLDSQDTTNLTMTADAGSGKVLTIDAINSGAGTASITVGATSGTAVNIGHATSEVNIGDNLNVAGNTIITGDLTVNGATTTISTTNLNVEDALIVLQAELGSGVANATDIGIIMERGSSGDNAAIIWDEGADKFLLGTTTETGADTDVTVTAGTVQVGKLEIDGTTDHIDVSTDLIVTSAADITLAAGGANVKPNANNTIALGVSGTAWSDLFLGVGAVVDFKAGDVTLTHVDTVGLLLNGSKQLQFGDSGSHIKQVADGQLEIESDVSVQIDSPIVDFEDDGVILQFGASDNVTLTHIDDTGLLLNSTRQLQFGDAGSNIKQVADGQLEIESDVSVQIDSPIVDFEDDGVVLQFGDGDDVTLTHVHDTGLLLNSTSQLQFSDGNSQISNPGAGLKLTDHAVIEVEAATSIQLDTPIVDFEDDGVVLQFGDGDDVTLTHVHNTGLLLNSGMKIQFGHADEHISGDATDLTVGSGGDINLTATGDVNLPVSVGLTFGGDTNKIEVDGDAGSRIMSIITENDMTLQAGGAAGDQFLLRNGGNTTENTKVCVGDANTYIERQGGSNNVNFASNRPITVSAGGALNLYGSAVNFKTQNGAAPVFNVSLDTDTILLANHSNDIVFKTNPGSATEIARFDTSEASLLMPTSNKVQFRETTTFIHSPGANTLDIETGTSNNGVINIGTDNSSNITIGKSGSGGTTTIHNLSLASITIDGDTGRMTFNGAGTDPFIERTAGSVMRFTDGSNTNVTLSDLASNAVDATAFTTIAGHRQVINSARRLALIGSGSVGGTHCDELYGYNGTATPSDIMLFCSGTIKPIGKNTPHGAGTKQERRNAALDSNLIASGSVFMRGLYHTDGAGDIANKSGQTIPHPVGAPDPSTGYTGYVFSVDQTNAANAAASSLHGTAFLHGNLRMSYASAAIHCPTGTGADLEIQNWAGNETIVKFDPGNDGGDAHVMIPSDATSKLAFGANTRYISNPNGTTDIKIETPGNVDIPTGKLVLGSDADGSDRSIVFGHTTLKSRIGIDDSADVFAINTDTNFESGNDLEIDASGNVTVGNGNLISAGGHIQGPTDGQLKLYSDTDVLINIDRDGDATNAKFKVQTNTNTTKFEVDEAGNTRAYGTMRIDGNQILASDGGTAITLDTSDNVTVGNNLILGNNIIKNSDNETTITLDANQNVTIGNNLILGNNIIKNSDDETTITLDASQNVTAAADLTATGALIGASLNLNEGNITNVGSIQCDSIAADTAGVGLDIQFTGNTSYNKISLTDNLNDALSIKQSTNVYMQFVTSNSSEKIQIHKNFLPVGSVDLGSTSQRFANIYTNDLNLCNEGRGNDVDGTSGNWTIQEGEDNLYVINNITGKRFKMMLQSVEDEE